MATYLGTQRKMQILFFSKKKSVMKKLASMLIQSTSQYFILYKTESSN